MHDDRRVPDDWFVGFSEGLAAQFWRGAAHAMADDDTALIRALLPLPPGASVLDLPCGDGRITTRLAAAGYAATGVDISAPEIERARAAGGDARFLVGDLRALPDLGPFDAVLSWGNSFGYLTPADTARSLAAMHDRLRPGGSLLLETATVAESLLVAGVRPTSEHEFGGVHVRRRNRYRVAESRLETAYEFTAGGRVEHAEAAHHVHTSGEIVRMLQAAGFRDVELRGPDGPYELGDPRLIVRAERP